ncbi:MAG: hypothetical protein ACRD35_08890 [Candidatus Acidiferrales bacterium]
MKQLCLAVVVFALTACSGPTPPPQAVRPVELKRFPLDSLDGVRAATGVSFDAAVSSDAKGSLRVEAGGPLTVPLFEVTDVSLDNAILLYQAHLQSESLEGKAYLEMWVRVPGKGEFFSKGLDRPVTGTMSWAEVATPFFLQAGQRPDLIRLNLVVEGKGRVWIDDIRLLRAPLPGGS